MIICSSGVASRRQGLGTVDAGGPSRCGPGRVLVTAVGEGVESGADRWVLRFCTTLPYLRDCIARQPPARLVVPGIQSAHTNFTRAVP